MSSKSLGKLAVLLVASLAVLVGVNTVLAPVIAKNAAAGEFEPLFAVMPDAQGFETLYSKGSETTLSDVGETVVGIYKETSGLGTVVTVSTSEGYTHEPIEFTIAFDTDGKISNMDLTAYPETKDFGADYPSTYVGQDSTLADVQLVAGVTYASKAFKDATQAAFDALIANDLLAAGEMGPEQILTNLLMVNDSAMSAPSGAAQYEEVSANGFTKGFKALNGTGYAFIGEDGEPVLAMVNATGRVMVLNTEGVNVTDSHPTVVENAKAFYTANPIVGDAKDEKRLAKLVGGEPTLEPIELGDTYNTVQAAYLVNGQYYGFIVKSYGYGNELMTEYYVMDANGAIVNMSVKEFIIEPDFFSDYTLDQDAYKAGLVGLDATTYTGEQTLIAGATISTNAITSATFDALAACNAIVEGN